jgi:hypothetical protein
VIIMATVINNAYVVSLSSTRIAGIKKYITNGKTEIPVAGQVMKPADVIKVFQASLDTRAFVKTKKAELKAALKERDDAEVARVATDDALKGWVTNRFGVDSTEAHEIGYAPKKVAEKSVETKATAIVRGKATREARHTLGPKQKAKIKGTTVVLTASADPTATTSSAPVVDPAPAAGQPAVAVVSPVVAAAASPVGTGH